jgi:hypothetical protein
VRVVVVRACVCGGKRARRVEPCAGGGEAEAAESECGAWEQHWPPPPQRAERATALVRCLCDGHVGKKGRG